MPRNTGAGMPGVASYIERQFGNSLTTKSDLHRPSAVITCPSTRPSPYLAANSGPCMVGHIGKHTGRAVLERHGLTTLTFDIGQHDSGTLLATPWHHGRANAVPSTRPTCDEDSFTL